MVSQRRQCRRLGDAREVVGQAHEPHGISDLAGRCEVPEPGAGQRKGLAHGAGHDQSGPALQQGQGGRRAEARELCVRLVHDHHGVGVLPRLVHGTDHVQAQGGTRGVVRRAQEDDVRCVGPHLLRGRLCREREVLGATPRGELRAGTEGQQGVHGVRGDEAQHGAALAPERLEDLLQDLVRAVGRPEVVLGETVAQVVCECAAQVREVAVRIPVQGHGRLVHAPRDGLHDVVRHGMRVLVRVQRDRDLQLGSPVRGHSAQVVAQRKGVEGCGGIVHRPSL